MTTAASRILVCGSRRWPWPDTVTTLLNRAADRHGDDLVVIEGASTGAASAAHHWCEHLRLPAWRHRCHTLTGSPGRSRRRPHLTTSQRHQRLLLDEGPRLVLAFHEDFHPDGPGSTADLCAQALAQQIPVWFAPTADPDRGLWLNARHYGRRADLITRRQTTTTAPETEPQLCLTTPSTSP